MSIKAHRRKKASFFATYKGWSVFVAKGESLEQDGEDGIDSQFCLNPSICMNNNWGMKKREIEN